MTYLPTRPSAEALLDERERGGGREDLGDAKGGAKRGSERMEGRKIFSSKKIQKINLNSKKPFIKRQN
jgi:hypothetical protein